MQVMNIAMPPSGVAPALSAAYPAGGAGGVMCAIFGSCGLQLAAGSHTVTGGPHADSQTTGQQDARILERPCPSLKHWQEQALMLLPGRGFQQTSFMGSAGTIALMPMTVPMPATQWAPSAQAPSADCSSMSLPSKPASAAFFSDGGCSSFNEAASPIVDSANIVAIADSGSTAAAMLFARRVELFQEMYDSLSRCDAAAMQHLRQRHWAPDFEMHWLDIGLVLSGHKAVAAMDEEIIRVASSISITLREARDAGSGDIELCIDVMGQFSHPVPPLFPAGRFAHWSMLQHVNFDESGKVRRISLSVVPPHVGVGALELSNLEGIAEFAPALAASQTGSHLLQLAIQSASNAIHHSVIAAVQGHIWDLADSPHGSLFLQSYIAAAPAAAALFISSEFSGRAIEASQHSMRSRIMERLFQHCSPVQVSHLADELVGSALALSRDMYGNFVMQRLLEHGSPEHRHRVAIALAPCAPKLARHQKANNVLTAAIEHCCEEDQHILAQALMSDGRRFARLATHIAGSFVVKKLRKMGLAG